MGGRRVRAGGCRDPVPTQVCFQAAGTVTRGGHRGYAACRLLPALSGRLGNLLATRISRETPPGGRRPPGAQDPG